MRVQQLIQAEPELLYSEEGIQTLRDYLAPLICASKAEQNLFYTIYAEYVKKDLKRSAQQKSNQQAETILEHVEEVQQSKWIKWLQIATGILVLLIFAYLLERYFNPPTCTIYFDKPPAEVAVGDTITLRNKSDKKVLSDHFIRKEHPIDFEWHLMDKARDTLVNQQVDYHWKWIVSDPGPEHHQRTIYLHAKNGETQEAIASDSFTVTIVCNTLKVGAISVKDRKEHYIVNDTIPFLVAVKEQPHLRYEWSVDEMNFEDTRPSPNIIFQENKDYTVRVSVTDTLSQSGKCIQERTIIIPISPEGPKDTVFVLPSYQLVAEQATIEHPLKIWAWLLPLLLLGPALWFWNKWRNRPDLVILKKEAQQLLLQNRFAVTDQSPYTIPFEKSNGKIEIPKEQYDIAKQLRIREQGIRKDIDIAATLSATVEKGGFPTLQYQYNTQPSDYLVLIDWHADQSHQARLFQYLVTMLQEEDVQMDVFYYQDQFHSFWNTTYPKGISLDYLQRKYTQQKLILFGSGHAFITQAEPPALLQEEWTQAFRKWTYRLLISPKPIVSWTHQEAHLYNLFPIFPADLSGIFLAIEFIQQGHTEEDLPSTLRKWEQQLTQRQTEIEEDVNRRWDTFRHHQQYLKNHSEVWRWLQALTVYPYPIWNVTIAIGKALESPVTYDNLLLLARIPWMKSGHFELDFWEDNWEKLSKEDERIARQAVKEELLAVKSQTNQSFAHHKLEKALAIQEFALDPNNAKNQETLRYLEEAKLLPKTQLYELDRIVDRHTDFKQTGDTRIGDTIKDYLTVPVQTESQKPAWVIPSFWIASVLSLLTLLLSLSLYLIPEGFHRNRIDKLSTLQQIHNTAIEHYHNPQESSESELEKFLRDSSQTLSSDQSTPKLPEHLSLSGLVLSKLNRLAPNNTLVQENLQLLLYQEGRKNYEPYREDSKYELSTAKDYFQAAIAYPKQDSITHAAMYGLANVFHLDEVQDSVCILLDTLKKVPTVSFFDSIPNLDSKATYCKHSIPDIASTDSPFFTDTSTAVPSIFTWNLTGTVIDAQTKAPINNVVVNGPNFQTRTNRQGNYQVSWTANNSSSQIGISFQTEGYVITNDPTVFVINPGQTRLATFELYPISLQSVDTIFIRGSIVDATTNSPLATVQIGSTRSNSDGVFDYYMVQEAGTGGKIRLTIEHPNYQPFQQDLIPTNNQLDLSILLQPKIWEMQFRPGPKDGQDAMVQMNTDTIKPNSIKGMPWANRNLGQHQELVYSYWTFYALDLKEGANRSYLNFPELSNIPDSATIISAKLSLFGLTSSKVLKEGNSHYSSSTYLNGAPENKGWIKRVIEPWNENTITWNTQPNTTESGRIELRSTIKQYNDDFLDLDVTTLVQTMVSIQQLFGFSLQLQIEEIYRGAGFHSSESDDPSKRPLLIVKYKY